MVVSDHIFMTTSSAPDTVFLAAACAMLFIVFLLTVFLSSTDINVSVRSLLSFLFDLADLFLRMPDRSDGITYNDQIHDTVKADAQSQQSDEYTCRLKRSK